jgi:hypothetical protein
MRTTLTLEDDVAKAIERIEKESGAGRKEVVNNLLRAAVALRREQTPTPRRRHVTRGFSVGKPLLDSYDDIQAVLDIAEGPERSG